MMDFLESWLESFCLGTDECCSGLSRLLSAAWQEWRFSRPYQRS